MRKVFVLLAFLFLALGIEAIGVALFLSAYTYLNIGAVYFLIARQCIKQIRTNHGW